MTDSNTTLIPSAAGVSGPVTVTASAPLFTAADVGRLISIMSTAQPRVASQAYAVGAVFVSSYAGVDRLYRVVVAGTSEVLLSSGTTPAYDLNAPRGVALGIQDGSATVKYLGAGRQCWGFGTITDFTDSTHVNVSVDPTGPFVAVATSAVWKLGEFSDARGWPASVTFHAGRTWWGGTTTKPQTIWASVSSDYENMTPTEPDGSVLDTDAITLALDDDEINTIRWLAGFPKGLAAGTSSGEFIIAPANTNAAMSPNNIRGTRQTNRGSDPNSAQLRASGVLLFVQRGARKLRQLEYDLASDSFLTTDLTQLADHITATGIVEAGFGGLPDGVIWAVRQDGAVVCLTYDREQRVRAWSRHVLGGNGIVESLAVVPAPDGTADEINLAVVRTINSATVRSVEYIRAPYRADLTSQTDGYFLDAGLSYSGAPANLFSGLDYLEGSTVKILADGTVRADAVVTGGQVALSGDPASTVHIGLPYLSRMVSLQPEAPSREGTAQGQVKRVSEISIRMLESGSGQYGRLDQLDAIPRSDTSLFTGDVRVAFPTGWDRQALVVVQTSDPLPLSVLGLITEVEANG